MVSRITQWTLDVADVELMADFWSAALGYRADLGDDGNAKLYPPDGSAAELPTVWLQAVAPPKAGKNRNHPDLNVLAGDDADAGVDAEVDRLIALGARRVDVGQSAADPFVVLADPEGNEFCILRRWPRRAEPGWRPPA